MRFEVSIRRWTRSRRTSKVASLQPVSVAVTGSRASTAADAVGAALVRHFLGRASEHSRRRCGPQKGCRNECNEVELHGGWLVLYLENSNATRSQ